MTPLGVHPKCGHRSTDRAADRLCHRLAFGSLHLLKGSGRKDTKSYGTIMFEAEITPEASST